MAMQPMARRTGRRSARPAPWTRLAVCAATIALLGLAACSDGVSPTSHAASVRVASGDAQAGVVGVALAAPVAVRVADASGSPVAGVSVTFAADQGGSLSPAQAVTGADGTASAVWTLGSRAGTQTARASVAGAGDAVLTATAAPGAAVGLSVAADSVGLHAIGESDSLGVVATDSFGNPVPGAPLHYASLDASVATVDARGLVTAVAPGRARVRVTMDTLTAEVVVGVRQVAASIALAPSAPTLETVGDTIRLRASVLDSLDNAITPRPTLSWQSSDPAVATVAAGGLVRASGTGETWILASLGGVVDSTRVRVIQQPASIDITPDTLRLTSMGQTGYLSARVLDTAGGEIADASVTWTILDPGVVSAAESGGFTAQGPGSARIEARWGTLADTALVVVDPRVAQVTLAPDTTLAALGDTVRLRASARDANGYEMTAVLAFRSLEPAVATVSDSGTVTAVAQGAAHIVASAADGAADTAVVTVAQAASPATSTIAAAAASITADGTSTTTITVQTKDAVGHPLTSGGATIVLTTSAGTLSAGASSGASVTATDNGDGTYSATLTSSTTVETATIGGTIGGSAITSGDASVDFVAGPLDHFAVEAAGGGAIGAQTAGTAFTIRITAQDANDHTVTSFTGTADVTSNRTGTSGLATTAGFTAGVLASHSVTLTQAGSGATLTATRTGGTGTGTSAAFTVSPAAASAARTTIGAAADTLTADGTSSTAITVQAKDAYGNTITSGGATVVISTSAGTLSAGASSGASVTATDNGDGTYSATLTASTTAGTATVSGTIGGSAITSGDATVSFVAGALDHFTVTTPASVTAGQSFNAQVTARDVNGNTVSGFSGAGNTVDMSSNRTMLAGGGTTAAFTNGTLAVAVTLKESGSGATLTATRTAGAEAGTSATFSVVAGPTASFVVTPATTTPLAGDPVAVTAQAVDAQGNPATDLAGATLSWTSTSPYATFASAGTTIAADGSSSNTLDTSGMLPGDTTQVQVGAGGKTGTSATITAQ